MRVMIRNLLATAAALVATVSLTGCVSAAEAIEAPAAVPHYSTVESQVKTEGLGASHYLETVRGLLSGIPHEEQSDADLVQGGKDLCAEIDNGATWDTFAAQIDDVGGDRAFYRSVIRAAVLSFCIEDTDVLA